MEAVISIALFVIFAAGAVYFMTAALLTSQTTMGRATAATYVQEGIEAVQSIDRAAWNNLADSPDSTYGLALSGNIWTLVTDPDNPYGDTRYTRTIAISDAYRDSANNPTDTNTDTFDPHTRKVTVTVDWVEPPARDQTLASSVYVTDWDAVAIADDTIADWSDGTLDNLRVSSLDDGELQIIQPTMEIGTTTATTSWSTVTLSNDYSTPVVITNVLDGNNPNSPVSARVRNASGNSFEVRLDFPTDNFAPSSSNTETVYYLVIEQGAWYLGDSDTKVEAGIVENVSGLNCSACGSWVKGEVLSYEHTYDDNPLVFHQIVSEHDSDWVAAVVHDDFGPASTPPGTDGFLIGMNGAQATTTHDAEDIAYVVFERESTGTFEGVSFETDVAGRTIRGYDNARYSDTFDQTYTSAPWVLASVFSSAGTDGSWIMLDAVTDTQLTVYVDEDQTTDAERSHTTEWGGYIAFGTTGTFYLNSATAYVEPTMEVGVVTNTATGNMEIGSTTATTSWSTITLTNTYIEPVVVATVQDGNNPNTPLTARVRNAAGNSFDLRLDIPPNNFAPVTSNSETVNYIVVEAGTWTVGDSRTKIEANVVADVSRLNCRTCGSWNNGTDVAYRNAYSAEPVVLHQIMSANDTDWVTSFVSDDTSGGNPPGTDGFQIAMNGAEVTATHDPEDIGYIVIAADATDTDGTLTFETEKTGDVVRGYTDVHTTETFTNTYSSAPIVVSAQVAMDGVEGSWAMLDAVTSTQVTVYVDEDQTLDSERSHTTEDYFYVTFSGSGSMILRDQTFLENPVTVTLQNSYTNPVVITAPYFTNDLRSPASIRVYDVSSDQFTMQIDAPTDNFPAVNTNFSDDVYYLVVEAGTWQIGDWKLEAHAETVSTVNSLANGWAGEAKTFNHTFTNPPIVLHQVMSHNDSSWVTSWVSRMNDRTNPPRATGMYLGLNAAEVTTSNAHAAETVGWIALANDGTSAVNGTEVRTYRVAEFAGGHQNGCYNYSHGGTYTAPMAFVSQMSMDGTEGSWATVCNLTGTTVGLHYDEDDYRDAERSHTDEAAGIIVFDGSFSYSGTTDTNTTSGSYESLVIGDGTTWRNFNLLDWVEDVACTDCAIQMQVRTADTVTDVASATYVGPDGTASTYFSTQQGDLLNVAHLTAPYIQYQATFSGTLARSPILYDTSLWAYEN